MTNPIATQPIVIRNSNGWRYLRNGLLGLLILLLLLAGLYGAGILRYEHKRGFFAPVWGPAEAVYFLERETRGLVFNIDWRIMGLTAADASNWSWVFADQISVRRLQPTDATLTTLRSWHETPVAGRLLETSPDAVFGILLATLKTEGGLSFTVNVSVPQSGQTAELHQQQPLFTGRGDNVLLQMRELMAVPGEDFYPAAIITTIDNNDYRVLLDTAEFANLYPEGIPPALLVELSQREALHKREAIVTKHTQLIQSFRQQGMSEAAARKAADAALTDEGYQVMEPRLVAIPISEPEASEAVFRISSETFKSDAFSDIAAAIAEPGVPVRKLAEPYDHESQTAVALNELIADGGVAWVVVSGDHYYRLLLRY